MGHPDPRCGTCPDRPTRENHVVTFGVRPTGKLLHQVPLLIGAWQPVVTNRHKKAQNPGMKNAPLLQRKTP